MREDCRKAVIGLLVLVFSHAPIPWVHQHAGMSNEQLSKHLRRFHAYDAATTLPQTWHVHFCPFNELTGNFNPTWPPQMEQGVPDLYEDWRNRVLSPWALAVDSQPFPTATDNASLADSQFHPRYRPHFAQALLGVYLL